MPLKLSYGEKERNQHQIVGMVWRPAIANLERTKNNELIHIYYYSD